MGLAYPELGVHPNDAYLFGDDLFVAPVITAGATTRDVTFPPGDWIDWWDSSVHNGSGTVQAPVDHLPLYLRRGGIVALLRPTIDTLAPTTDPTVESFANDAGVLWVRAATEASTTLYDGTQLTVSSTTASVTSGTIFTQGAVIEILAATNPGTLTVPALTSVDAVAASSSGWFYDGSSLWLRVGGGQSIALPH